MKLSNYTKVVCSRMVILASLFLLRQCHFMSPWFPISFRSSAIRHGIWLRPASSHCKLSKAPRPGQNLFRVRFDHLTPSEKNCLRATARLGAGPRRTAISAKAAEAIPLKACLPVRDVQRVWGSQLSVGSR